jgi:hypothetical protein
MITYEILTDEFGKETIKRDNQDGSISWIPTDPANSDYRAYLNKDKAEQSTPILPE